MHPRNFYKDHKPDFGRLADFHSPLKPFLIKKRRARDHGSYTLDFSNPEALRELTRALLEQDYGLKVNIPAGRLVPTVTLRLNYLHWVEDLLADERGTVPRGGSVHGLDIGTGASCVYPLLGSKLNGWRFLATEIDRDSLKYATENVSANKLDSLISVVQVPESVVLVGAITEDEEEYDFCMCNPPFFKDAADLLSQTSPHGHRPLPCTFNTGSRGETVTRGGEVGFVGRILEDSLKLKKKVRWYTSMLGKKKSLKVLKSMMCKHEVPVVTTTQLVQGKTVRWAIAWSFCEHLKHKPGPSVSGCLQADRKRKKPLTVEAALDFDRLARWMEQQLSDLQIGYQVTKQEGHCMQYQCTADKKTWCHQRRKRRLLQRISEGGEVTLKPKAADVSSEEGTSMAEACSTQASVCVDGRMEALYAPCSLQFSCTIVAEVGDDEPHLKKPAPAQTSDQLQPQATRVRMEFDSESRDALHQLLQYLRNNLPV